MKKRLFGFFVSLCCVCINSGAYEKTLHSWTLSKPGSVSSVEVEVPCTVAGGLAEAGILPENMFEGQNYRKIDTSLFSGEWTYTTKFTVPKEKGRRAILHFGSLNFYADILLNGKKLASSDTTCGAFVTRDYDVTEYVRQGRSNKLAVTLAKAVKGDLNVGFVDWNPRALGESMGINSPVVLKTCGDAIVTDAFIKPSLDTKTLSSADLEVAVEIRNLVSKPLKAVLTLSYENGKVSVPVDIPSEGCTVTLDSETIPQLHIENPRVWWTWDLGSPELYHMDLALEIDGTVSDCRSERFGVRSIESRVENNCRQFYLNGRRILIKGAGWTDELLLRDTRESELLQAEYVRHMNLNCIRFENIWGKDDNIYNCCDSLGLMAMVGFSCQWEWEDYCGLPETKGYGCINDPRSEDMAVRYFRDQVIRLHNHPSVICWLTGSDRIPNPRLEERYMEIYSKYEYRPYVCSAKNISSKFGGPSGTKMEGPYEYVGPDYWYLDTRDGGAFGFNTETGVGMNIPQIESVRKMIPEPVWPLSADWDYHCTASSSAMNSTRVATEAINGIYGEASTLEDYVARAHALDYDATKAMFESFRCNMPASTGIIQWMLNSAWPSMYWQLYDYYKVPTAGYYGVRKACTPVQAVYNYKDSHVYVVNETPEDKKVRLRVTVYDSSSSPVSDDTLKVFIRSNSSVRTADVTVPEGGCFLATQILDRGGAVVADNFYCLPSKKNVYDWKHHNWYRTPISEYEDLGFVTRLPKCDVKMTVGRMGRKVIVTLKNESDVISYQNILKFTNPDGSLVTPVYWSDNFVSLLPGQTRILECLTPEGCSGEVKVQTWNSTVTLDQTANQDTRDRSRFAHYSFRDDDRYKVEDPYRTVSVNQVKGKKVKNVIFMIGDGMGVHQISAGWVLNGGRLNIDNFLYTGFSRTYCTDKLITDSCAGGSALATGVKTKRGYMGVDADGKPVDASLVTAMKKGKKTGIIVTCRLNDATPIDFCGHSLERDDEYGIATQYVDSGVDFIAGGGIKFWQNREDGRDLVQEMKDRGYEFASTNEQIEACKGDKVLALMAETEMVPAIERDNYLARTTMKAINTLDNKNGFFLMVEGSCIDDWGHRKKIGYVAEELFDFDRTIGEVLKWAEKDGHTLVVVTADHGCGGLTILNGDLQERSVKVNFSTTGHDGILVPVFAYGPGASNFVGVHENSEIGQIIKDLLK